MSLDPGALLLLGGAAILYESALARLRARGRGVSGWQRAAWYAGLGLVAAGLLGPIDAYAERMLSAHMAQHLLIADLAAPLLLVGLRTPVLQFLVPPSALRRLARLRRVRAALSVLRRPLVAIPVYALVLYAWHLSFMFEAAMASSAVHALQHQSFLAASLLVWWAPLEPARARVPGELWKAAHVLGARLVGMFLGMAFIAMRLPVYVEAYGPGVRPFGLTPLADQQVAGGLMLGVDLLIMLAGFAFFFWRAAEDHDRPRAVAQAEHLR